MTENFKFHPKPPPPPAPPLPRVSVQRCYKCDRLLTPGEKVKIHEVLPVAVCLGCVGDRKLPELRDAVVVGDEENLAGNAVAPCDGAGDPGRAEGSP